MWSWVRTYISDSQFLHLWKETFFCSVWPPRLLRDCNQPIYVKALTIKNSTYRRKGKPPTLLAGILSGIATTQHSIWRFLKKLKTEPAYDTPIPLLGIYLKKKRKSLTWKHTWTLIFTADYLQLPKYGLLGDSVVKNLPAHVEDLGSIPESGGSLGGGNCNRF